MTRMTTDKNDRHWLFCSDSALEARGALWGIKAQSVIFVKSVVSYIVFSLFYQGIMIIPEFRKPEQMAGISLHFPSYFIRIQTLFDRTNPGLAHIKPEANQTGFYPKRLFRSPGLAVQIMMLREVQISFTPLRNSSGFLSGACSGPDPGTRSPSSMSKNYAGNF